MNDQSNDNSTLVLGLTLLFIALKLTDKIDWGWIWVLSPLWLEVVVVILIGVVIAALALFIKSRD